MTMLLAADDDNDGINDDERDQNISKDEKDENWTQYQQIILGIRWEIYLIDKIKHIYQCSGYFQ